MRYYPIHLDLKNRPVLVVGGGVIAEDKALQLVEAGAAVRLVSPTLTAQLSEMVNQSMIEYRCGNFIESDLAGVVLVISATNDQSVNEEVAQAAAARGLLHNVVDQPALCSFITPALVTRGDLQISISTGGGSPSVAQRVQREIGELIGEEYGELLRTFAESEAVDLIRAGRRAEAQRIADELLAASESPVHITSH